MRSAMSESSTPSSPFTAAAVPLSRPSQRITGTGTRSPETGKFSTALAVSPPHSCCSDEIDMPLAGYLPQAAPGTLSPHESGVRAVHPQQLLVDPVDELGVDALRLPGPPLEGADQVAQPHRLGGP